MLFLSLILSILFGWGTSYLAQQRGRDPVIWFLLGMFLGILGPLVVLVMPDASKQKGKTQGSSSNPFYTGPDSTTIEVQPSEVYTVTQFHQHEWYYYDQAQERHGPITFEDLRRMWHDNVVGGNTFVWHEGRDSWTRISEIPDLLLALNRPINEVTG